jgi:sortase A
VIPVTAKPAPAEAFAVLHVPAFGTTYANVVAETTDWWTVLNLDEKGIGRYESTQLPGEPGNFALAGHRSGPLINSFREVMNLRVGDPLFVETADGWYTYRFRSIEYVLPDAVDVLNPFPRLEGVPGEDRILTLTTCHPKWAGSDERAIAYSVFEGFQPRSDGPPAELIELNPTMEGTQAPRGDQES